MLEQIHAIQSAGLAENSVRADRRKLRNLRCCECVPWLYRRYPRDSPRQGLLEGIWSGSRRDPLAGQAEEIDASVRPTLV